jgi:hypothetical protein
MQRNTVRRSLGIAGVLALGSIVIACAQQQPAPPASGTFTPPPPSAATVPVAPVTGHWTGRGLCHDQADDDRISATLSEGTYDRLGARVDRAVAGGLRC